MKNRTRKGKSPVRIFLLSALTGVIVVLIILALLSFIITKTDIPMHNLPYYLIAAYAVGAVISAFICARKLQMRGFLFEPSTNASLASTK